MEKQQRKKSALAGVRRDQNKSKSVFRMNESAETRCEWNAREVCKVFKNIFSEFNWISSN